MGKSCGHGVKGQTSRSSVSIKTEGGQMSLIKILPKRGFSWSKSVDYTAKRNKKKQRKSHFFSYFSVSLRECTCTHGEGATTKNPCDILKLQHFPSSV